MSLELTAFESVPDFAKGYVKDLRVRWALEEAGLTYTERLISQDEKDSAAYRQRQPFAQVPVLRDGDVDLFESGAILMHLAEKSDVLAPGGAPGKARARSWVCAALNSVEPEVSNLVLAQLFWVDEPWAKSFETAALERLDRRLAALEDWLGDKDWLEGQFSIGDIMMVTVLRDLIDRGPLERFPKLGAYRHRGEARPAFQRALRAQLDAFDRFEGTVS